MLDESRNVRQGFFEPEDFEKKVRVKLSPDVEQIRAGVVNTPIARTNVILLGHGHVDHAADVPALLTEGIISDKPVLIADRSTTNALAALKGHFSCVAPIDYREPEVDAQRCPVERVRITPIHHAHAPHLELAGLAVAAFGGRVKEPMAVPVMGKMNVPPLSLRQLMFGQPTDTSGDDAKSVTESCCENAPPTVTTTHCV